MAAPLRFSLQKSRRSNVPYHHFWLPLMKLLLLDVAVVTVGYSCTAWMLRIKDPSERTNPFLLKMWLAVAAFGPAVFILLKLGLFR